jgi:hypothetical protein
MLCSSPSLSPEDRLPRCRVNPRVPESQPFRRHAPNFLLSVSHLSVKIIYATLESAWEFKYQVVRYSFKNKSSCAWKPTTTLAHFPVLLRRWAVCVCVGNPNSEYNHNQNHTVRRFHMILLFNSKTSTANL